jgi:hypothetical protein
MIFIIGNMFVTTNTCIPESVGIVTGKSKWNNVFSKSINIFVIVARQLSANFQVLILKLYKVSRDRMKITYDESIEGRSSGKSCVE